MSTARASSRLCGATVALLALALAAFAGTSGEERNVAGVSERWELEDQHVALRCSDARGALEDAAIPYYNRSALLLDEARAYWEQWLHLHNCPLPRGSLAHALAARRYPAVTLWHLELRDLPPHPPPRAKHFTSLHVEHLYIYFAPAAIPPHVDAVIFEPLAELTDLHVSGAVMSPMPAALRLVFVSLRHGQSTGVWGGCTSLQELWLDSWVVPEAAAQAAGTGWLAHCTQLKRLRMERVPPHMQWWALRDTRTLTKLEIRECERLLPAAELNTALTGLLLDLLILSDNGLTSSYLTELTFPSTLMYLELSGSTFRVTARNDTLSVWRHLAQLPDLGILKLEKCIFVDFCATLQAGGPLPNLWLLSLNGTHIGQLCLGTWDSLKVLDLRYSGITELQVHARRDRPSPHQDRRRRPSVAVRVSWMCQWLVHSQLYRFYFRQLLQLPRARAMWLQVILGHNAIRSAPLDEASYKQLMTRFEEAGRVTIYHDEMKLDCDCAHGWFARALRALPKLVLEGAVLCSGDATPLLSAPAERLECERFECGGCTCRRAWRDNATVATCERGAARAVPRVPGLRALHAAGNRIDTLHAHDLQNNLLELDLSNNSILRLAAPALDALFAVSARRVWLAGNHLVCTCESQAMVSALQQHSAQVPDFKNITCEDGRALHALAVPELCVTRGQTALMATLVAGGVLISLSALAGALYYRFGRELRIFLYARGMCLCCMQEDELDAERPYDAFVSFAHADERLVTEQLLPELEREPHALKLCVHYRDWEPGEMIPTQIRLSVERSRRTVIVLSRNFLRSVWGLLEFRLAHVSALEEGRVRVVVVVLDDVLEDPRMDAELRGYLRTHTYVVWGSRWFWDQLRYALPHRPARAPRTNRTHHVTPRAPDPDVTVPMNAPPPRTSSIPSSSRVNSGSPHAPHENITVSLASPPQCASSTSSSGCGSPVSPRAPDADVAVSLAARPNRTSSTPSSGHASPVLPRPSDADAIVSMATPPPHTSSPALLASASIELTAFDNCARLSPQSPGTEADVTHATSDTAL